mmetsp:Transcript_3145/g.3747  ORF Transcript_3145/g.3747 Transcript_3145/m.3747 type:complete len:394 (+) Transcript_3145:20-1201(+)
MNDHGRSNNEYTNNENEVQFFNIDEESAQNDVMNLSVDLSSLDSHAAHVEENPYNRNNNDINTPTNEVLHQQIRHFANKEEEYQAIQAVARAQRDSQLPSADSLNKDEATLKTVPINEIRLKEQIKDPKRYCKFCKKHFSHQGSYGRHLDLKKGDELHPMEEIAKIRSKVVRRNGFLDNERLEARKSKKKVASRIYNKRENVKEKNKIRRKLRDRDIKAKLLTNEWFLNQLGGGSTRLEQSTFAKLVCLYIPVNSWPLGSPPGKDIFENLIAVSANHSNALLEEVKDSYSVWQGYSFEKRRDIWFSEQKQTLEETLGNFTLVDLQERNQIMDKQKKVTFENLCKQDNLVPSSVQGYQEDVNFIDSNESEDDDTSQTITGSSFQPDGTNYFENH